MKLGLYQHYKGEKYRVFGICRHSETLEELVVYQTLYGDFGLWVRPLAMFQETIEIKQKVQSGKREYYNQSNHYCLHEGCYWRKKLPAQE